MRVRAGWLGDPLLHLLLIAVLVAGLGLARRASRDGAVYDPGVVVSVDGVPIDLPEAAPDEASADRNRA